MGIWDKLSGLFGASGQPPAEEVAEPLSPEEQFRCEVLRIAEAAPFIESATPDPHAYALDLVYAGGEQMKCFLGNLRAETRELSPEERELRILNFLSVMTERTELPETWEDAESTLLPVLRASTFFNLGVGPQDAEKQPIRQLVLPFLWQAIAIDQESSMAYAMHEHLERWGVDAERAHARALENLALIADRGIELYDPTAPYPIWQVASGDAYESSRLLLPGWLASFADKVEGRPVAVVPDRATLLVTGDARNDALARLIESADREYRAAPRSISPALYTVDAQGRVVPFRVAADHPLAARVHEADVHLAAVEYESQKPRLQAELEAREEDVFVASYSVVERANDGAVLAYCTWGENVDSLLPITDLVGFVGGNPASDDGWHFLVPWSAVEEMIGDHWRREPEIEPPRMRTLRWPDAERLASLRRHAIE